MIPFQHFISMLVAALAVGGWADRPASASASTQAHASTLVAVQAAHHKGFDRVVFRFSGALPTHRHVSYVNRLIADGSGRTIPIAGRAILRVTLDPATAHDATGHATVPGRAAFALPNVTTVVQAGDFESVVSYGVGLAKRTPVRLFTLTRPSRVVIDIQTPFKTVLKPVYFLNRPRFDAGTPPFVGRVLRPVLPSAPATGVMDRLFAGPTAGEQAAGLRLLQSRATGFAGLSVSAGVARVRLTGGCGSGGSTITIADEIFPTLKHVQGIHHVKIFDPAGHTETPSGPSDSIPFCLEP